MANQTRQLAELLEQAGASVGLVQTNAPYRPACIGAIRGVRALFRLIAYAGSLWSCAGRVDLLHVMANSGWSWHLFAAPAIWIAKLRGVPVIVNYRGGEAASFLARSARWVIPTLARADRVAVPSGYLREVFERFDVHCDVLPNIISTDRFHPAETPFTVTQAPHVVVARNLEPIYDNACAIRALGILVETLPAASLTLAGAGPERAALESLAREVGIADRVTFAGRLDRTQMAELYRRADVVLNPSLVDNMPNSVLEALASGVPVVSTRVGGVPHVVKNEITALLVAPGDAAAMAASIVRLSSQPALAQALRENGLAEVQQYTWLRIAPRLLELYGAVLDRTCGKVHAI
jgi:glycosyltransferase involved in cell wall biosynthesis